MRKSVCTFVCLWVIRNVLFKCVCFLLDKSSLRLTLFPVAAVKDHLLTAHLPAHLIRNFMHAFGQLGDNASLFPAASKNISLGCKLAVWDYLSLQFSRTTILCFVKAFEKLSLLYFVIVRRWRAASGCKNFRKRYSSVFIYSQPPPLVLNWNTYEV